MADMIKKVLSVSFLVILASCRSAPVAQTGEAVIEQETAVINPEPVKGRGDVYESMARCASCGRRWSMTKTPIRAALSTISLK